MCYQQLWMERKRVVVGVRRVAWRTCESDASRPAVCLYRRKGRPVNCNWTAHAALHGHPPCCPPAAAAAWVTTCSTLSLSIQQTALKHSLTSTRTQGLSQALRTQHSRSLVHLKTLHSCYSSPLHPGYSTHALYGVQDIALMLSLSHCREQSTLWTAAQLTLCFNRNIIIVFVQIYTGNTSCTYLLIR